MPEIGKLENVRNSVFFGVWSGNSEYRDRHVGTFVAIIFAAAVFIEPNSFLSVRVYSTFLEHFRLNNSNMSARFEFSK